MRHAIRITALVCLAVLLLPAGFAADDSQATRQKSISFEDGLVEGLSQGKGNMGSMITKQRDARRPHLYDRMLSFAREKQESIREFRYQP